MVQLLWESLAISYKVYTCANNSIFYEKKRRFIYERESVGTWRRAEGEGEKS